MNVLINATNLHHGGGVQVASSIIYELSRMRVDINFSVFCSDEVYRSLPSDIDLTKFDLFEIINVYGFFSYNKRVVDISRTQDISLTVFGPCYFKLKSKTNITGFAQPWIIYKNNPLYDKMSLLKKIKTKLKFKVQEHFFKKSDYLVVEHKEVLNRLVLEGFNPRNISVISNTISSPFIQPSLREKINFPDIKEKYVLGFLGRPYPHKNISILKEVNNVLIDKYHLNVGFLFSLSDDEMNKLAFDSLDNFYSCGVLKNTQCPNFYERIDALIFPSLLECFSVSPLEAMMMNKLVFASNYSFIREVYGESVFYFDPLDAENIANVIAGNLLLDNKERIKVGNNLCVNMCTARQRAESYIDLFNEI
ncbi:glycosyltransferase [Photobacterium damselae]|uniref:glycosyltransferase n=1 Tax=Photobacterium damselae TaxID=38293 RepID=UPI00083B9BA4|nr:glycosyltransferase [Photobacterium damselae]ODA22639.1 hypothetical protein A0J46_18415 [Photobacterium damselae subsp. damselae]